MSASSRSFLSWRDTTSFFDNIATTGGDIFVFVGVRVEWSGETSFISNHARSSCGAVGSTAFISLVPVYANNEKSNFFFEGTTSFVNNECVCSEGGTALVQPLDVAFENGDAIFLGNTAGRSGSAVYIRGTGIRTVFKNVSFITSTAQIGGDVRVTASGTTINIRTYKIQVTNPATFKLCSFVGNVVFGTGGAVDSASRQGVYANTLFKGNVVNVCRGLRLTGKVFIGKCSFTDNVSELGGGPALSNIGSISKATTSNFHHSVIICD